MQLGIIWLSDVQAGQTAQERVADAIHYASLADRLGLDVFALAGHTGKLKLGISTHFYAGEDAEEARRIYPYYHEYLRPKTPGGRGFLVSEDGFRAGTAPGQALMIGSPDEITAKILDAHDTLGGIDRFYGQVDWGGLPHELVEASISLPATKIAPALRAALDTEPRALQLT